MAASGDIHVHALVPERIRVNVGVTRNLGDFNSVRLDLSYDTNVGPDEDFDTAASRAWEKAEKQVEDKLAEYETE